MSYKPKFPVKLNIYSRSKDGLGSPYISHTVNNINEFNSIVTRYINLKNVEIYDGGYRVFGIYETPRKESKLTVWGIVFTIIGGVAGVWTLILAYKSC